MHENFSRSPYVIIERVSIRIQFTLALTLAPFAFAAGTCPSGGAVTQLRLEVEPDKGGEHLPVTMVHKIPAGYKIHYHPVRDAASKGEVALLVVPPGQSELIVMEGKPDTRHNVWTLPVAAQLIGIVYGAHGFDEQKVKTFVRKDPEMLAQLADYAEKTAITEQLLQEVSNGKSNNDVFEASLRGLAARSGGTGGSILTPGRTTEQQTAALFMAINPTLGAYDPLAPTTEARVMQSATLAASIGSMFFGSTFGLGASGATMVLNLRSLAFPNTEFRSSFAQVNPLKDYTLCGKKEATKQRTKIAYLWMTRINASEPPAIRIGAPSHHLLNEEIVLPVTGAPLAPSDVRGVRQWWLTTESGQKTPVSILPGVDGKELRMKLPAGKITAGRYKISGLWDWQALAVPGEVVMHAVPTLKNAHLNSKTAMRLIAGKGPVEVEMEGDDFRFVERIRCQNGLDPLATPVDVKFLFKQSKLVFEIDTQPLAAGIHKLHLTQRNGNAAEIAFAVFDAGEKPSIGAPRLSSMSGLPMQLMHGEIAMDRPVSLVLPVKGLEHEPALEMRCGEGAARLVKVGDSATDVRFTVFGTNEWFVTFDPRKIGSAGCKLQATVIDANAGKSEPAEIGVMVSLPQLDKFELSEERVEDALFAGTLWGTELERIERVGWDEKTGRTVAALPVPGPDGKQALKVALPWPAPSPHAPLYVWLRGEDKPRRSSAKL